MFERLFLLFHARSAIELLASLKTPLLFGFLLYQFNYPFVLFATLARRVFAWEDEPPLTAAQAPAALLVLPTLMRTVAELAGMKRAITSAVKNGYPGKLIIVAAIDDAPASPEIYRELLAWLAVLPRPASVKLYATSTLRRTGKAVAIDNAVRFVRAKVDRGEIDRFPPVFFNMDGDSFLGPEALERMVQRLRRPRFRGLWTTRPMIVTSNVQIDPRAYWRDWRTFFSVRGQIALSVAREYLTSITVGKYNCRILPVTEASGALYCTSSELQELAPRWAAFMQTLTFGDWCRWWLGAGARSFARSNVEPCPEALTGPGDDTWMTWLACCARYNQDGSVLLELPNTPIHAIVRGVQSYIFRPVSYEPNARLHTKTPTTAKGLFAQRVRWNSSRVADLQRWAPAFAYHVAPGIFLVVGLALNIYVHVSVAWALLVWPFTRAAKGGALASSILAIALSFGVRGASTVFALAVDRSLRRGWRTLLALPVALPYHFVFNMVPTMVGVVKDVFLFGVNTRFSPEETLIAGGLTRIALAYRLRRAFTLAWRSVWVGDVPLGAFWFGWYASPWTTNGFTGWTNVQTSTPATLSSAKGASFARVTRVPAPLQLAVVDPLDADTSARSEPRLAHAPPPGAAMHSIHVPPMSNVVSLAAIRARRASQRPSSLASTRGGSRKERQMDISTEAERPSAGPAR